jgi:hypothetical protein
VTATGCWAASVATIEDPVGRRRALIGFARALILLGAMLLAQSLTNLSPSLPPAHGWTPLTVGLVLLYLAITGPAADFRKRLPPFEHINARRQCVDEAAGGESFAGDRAGAQTRTRLAR